MENEQLQSLGRNTASKNRKPNEERICNLPVCPTGKVQDMCHFFVECPRFFDFRLKKMNSIATLNKSELYFHFNNLSINQ